jgi:hypothetical protein
VESSSVRSRWLGTSHKAISNSTNPRRLRILAEQHVLAISQPREDAQQKENLSAMTLTAPNVENNVSFAEQQIRSEVN